MIFKEIKQAWNKHRENYDYNPDGASSALFPKETIDQDKSLFASFIDKKANDVVSTRSLISFKHSIVSGIEDWDMQQTFNKMSDYLEKFKNNPKPVHLLTICLHIVNLWDETKDFELVFHSHKMLADLYVELRKIENAIEIYAKLIKLTDDHDKYKEQLLMYEQLGYWEHMLRKYDEAIVYFK